MEGDGGEEPSSSALLGFLVFPRNPPKSPDRFTETTHEGALGNTGEEGEHNVERPLIHAATSQSREESNYVTQGTITFTMPR